MKRLVTSVGLAEESDEINLTPMLDVIFIMLIFFVVTASFVREEGVAADRSEQSPISQDDAKAILVEIYPSDEIRINGFIVDLRAVRPNLEQLHAVNPDQPVVIQTAAASTTQALVSVLDAAEQTGIRNVSVGALD